MKTLSGCLCLLLLTVLTGCWPDKVSIPATSVDSIRIVNIQNFSHYDQRLITNRDTIRAICKFFGEARRISIDTINPKLSTSLCDIYVYTRDEGKKHLYYKTTEDYGNLLWYSSSSFRSDSLLYWLR